MRGMAILLVVGWMGGSVAIADDRSALPTKPLGAGERISAGTDGSSGQGSAPASARGDSRRRGGSPRGHHPTRFRHPRQRIGVSWNYGWYGPWGPYASFWWDPWYYGYGGGYGYGPGWGRPRDYPAPGESYGALDLDLSPERAEVWIDGQRVGVADEFDGFPEYLWLEEGTYDVAFYLPGFRTLARQYTIVPGRIVDVADRLEHGEATHPSDLPAKTHERRDERLRRERERRAQLGSGRAEPGSRVEPPSREWMDARSEPASLRLVVEPEDASVYLDGRFLGSARELARLRAGLLVDPGAHRLEIVRPGYRALVQELELVAGESERLEVSLDEEAGAPLN